MGSPPGGKARRPAVSHAHDAAGEIGKPSFGRAGDDDIFALGIIEDIFDPLQTGEVFHFVGGHALPRDNRRFQPIERNFAKLADVHDLRIERRLGRVDPLLEQHARRIGVRFQAQDAFGIDDHAGLRLDYRLCKGNRSGKRNHGDDRQQQAQPGCERKTTHVYNLQIRWVIDRCAPAMSSKKLLGQERLLD
jgi:hypothetical protein